MKAGEVVFQKLLDGKIQYVVPLYQRTYSWEEEQWEQLWEDLLEIYVMDAPKNHFIGSVVTQQIPNEPESVSRYTLIDGQQRMTTMFILLSVIRQLAAAEPEIWNRLADEILNTCLINEFNDGDEYVKLMPTQQDRVPFRSVVNGEPAASGSQIERARSYFFDKLQDGDVDGNPMNLRKLHSCIVNRLDMVSIHLEQDDSPNRIFESLNNTGMPLSVADLIRNYFLMNITDPLHQETAYNDYWYPMEQALSQGGQNVSANFFWHYLMKDGSLPRKDETYDEMKIAFDRPTQQIAIRALQDFAKFSSYYAQITESNTTTLNEHLATQINRLNQWEVAVAYPFLLKSWDAVASGDIQVGELVAAMEMIESFVVRRTICGVPTNQLRRIFAQLSAQVDIQDFVDSARNHLLANRWPTDDEFVSKLVEFPLYSRGRAARTRLVLWSLERSFGSKETPEDTDDITIEHVMPQTLSAEWVLELRNGAQDVHERWLHTIGNLTLTGYNPELSNQSFEFKKAWYDKANFELSKSIQSCDRWTEQTIRKRAAELARRAVQIWGR